MHDPADLRGGAVVTELRIIDRNGQEWAQLPDDYWKRPEYWGLMWRMPGEDTPDREAWFIVLPNGAGGWTTTDHAAVHGSLELGPRWDVTGVPPKLTVSPSIDASPEWHGWIKDGVMTP